MATLTIKQEAFIAALLRGESQRVAYREAFPHSVKWKDKTVDERASRLFKTDKVQARWEELTDKAIEQIEKKGIIDKEYVLQEIKDMLETDISDIAEIITVEKIERNEKGEIIYGDDGKPLTDFHQVIRMKDMSEMSEAALKSISEIGHNKYGLYIKRYDKQKTIDQAGKHLKLFTDKVELEVTKMPAIKFGK